MEQVKEILNSENKVTHDCKCISLGSRMVAYKHCKIHNIVDRDVNIIEKTSTKKYDDLGRVIKSTVVTEFGYESELVINDSTFYNESEATRAQRMDDNRYVVGNKDLSYKPGMNAANLRLYVIIGLILG